MKQQFRQFFFGTNLGENKVLNIGWLLFRLHIGLSLAIHAGLPKMYTGMSPAWFNEQVAGLGFTFPSPAFWATIASWGEFVGGICIALGLLTRFSALQLAFQFFIISFLWYDKPEPLTGMYFQQTLFWGYVLAAFAGGGRYSLDNIIMKRKMKNITLPVKIAAASILMMIGSVASAQKGPLNGSGKLVTKTFNYKSFDKLEILDLNGKINVEIGKPFSISVSIDDNLEKLLKISENNGELKMELEGNQYNKMYIEKTNISINVTMPEVSVIKLRSNSNMIINGIIGRYFRLNNYGNGSVILKGSIDELDISCSGNGLVNANEIVAQSVKIIKRGNGIVYINTDNSFSANGSGNGDIINKGEGKPDNSSSISGNGEIEYKKDESGKPASKKRVEVKITNRTTQWIELTVKYPGKGSYGIEVGPGESVNESFPEGAKIFKGNQFTVFKKPAYEVSAEANQNFIIKE